MVNDGCRCLVEIVRIFEETRRRGVRGALDRRTQVCQSAVAAHGQVLVLAVTPQLLHPLWLRAVRRQVVMQNPGSIQRWQHLDRPADVDRRVVQNHPARPR